MLCKNAPQILHTLYIYSIKDAQKDEIASFEKVLLARKVLVLLHGPTFLKVYKNSKAQNR